MCFNRQGKQMTFCCGCSVACGITIFSVIQIIGFTTAICSLSPINIVFSVVNLAPLVALYFLTDSYCVRMWNFVQQCVYLVLLVLALIFFIASVEPIIDLVCSDADIVAHLQKETNYDFGLEDCERQARIPAYLIWLTAALVLIPLQFMWVRVFKYYLDELKDPHADYSQLPTEE